MINIDFDIIPIAWYGVLIQLFNFPAEHTAKGVTHFLKLW